MIRSAKKKSNKSLTHEKKKRIETGEMTDICFVFFASHASFVRAVGTVCSIYRAESKRMSHLRTDDGYASVCDCD